MSIVYVTTEWDQKYVDCPIGIDESLSAGYIIDTVAQILDNMPTVAGYTYRFNDRIDIDISRYDDRVTISLEDFGISPDIITLSIFRSEAAEVLETLIERYSEKLLLTCLMHTNDVELIQDYNAIAPLKRNFSEHAYRTVNTLLCTGNLDRVRFLRDSGLDIPQKHDKLTVLDNAIHTRDGLKVLKFAMEELEFDRQDPCHTYAVVQAWYAKNREVVDYALEIGIHPDRIEQARYVREKSGTEEFNRYAVPEYI